MSLIHFDGSFIENGTFYTGPDASARFEALLGRYGAVEATRVIDGFYRFVAGDDRNIWLGTDHVGSYPLFYRTTPGFSWGVHATELGSGSLPDDQSLCCLLACGYVTGNYTLYRDVLETEPGAVYHWSHESKKLSVTPMPSTRTEFDADFRILDDLTSALFRAVPASASASEPSPSPALTLSLSGGLDSRIILAQAMRHGKKISAFSYGKRDSPDHRIARALAEAYNIPWTFHDIGEYRHLIEDATQHWKFAYHAFSGRSIPHEQDYISGSLAGSGTLFLGGHSGDLIAGSYLTPDLAHVRTRDDLVGYLFHRHAQLTPVTSSGFYESVRHRIGEEVDKVEFQPGLERAGDAALRFNHLNRQRRYIVNSVRAYTMHGRPFFLPLYTRALMTYFANLPVEEKLDQKWYKQFASEHLFQRDLAQLAKIESTRPMKPHFVNGGISEWLKLKIRILDRYKIRKRVFNRQVTGYADQLYFLAGETTDRDITEKKVSWHFPYLPDLADKFKDEGCVTAAAHLHKLKDYKASQLNINGFYVLYYLGILNGFSRFRIGKSQTS